MIRHLVPENAMERHQTVSRRSLIQQGAAAFAVGGIACSALLRRVPDKLVVLTFDDAVKSHRTFVGPLLKEFGFRATFFVTHCWMDDTEHFMNWEEIAELHRMGFEIGNHSWTHPNFADPKIAARMTEELGLVEEALSKVGVPR